MAVITKVEPTSLKIEVNKPPISYIELPSTLTQLTVTLSVESLEISRLIGNIIKPPKPEGGNVYLFCNKVELSPCHNIQNELQRIYEKFPGSKGWYEEEVRDKGFVHTVQVPVKVLHAAGFLTDEQVKDITAFVHCHDENKLK